MSTLGALLNNFQENRKSYFLITGLGPYFYSKKLKYILDIAFFQDDNNGKAIIKTACIIKEIEKFQINS